MFERQHRELDVHHSVWSVVLPKRTVSATRAWLVAEISPVATGILEYRAGQAPADGGW